MHIKFFLLKSSLDFYSLHISFPSKTYRALSFYNIFQQKRMWGSVFLQCYQFTWDKTIHSHSCDTVQLRAALGDVFSSSKPLSPIQSLLWLFSQLVNLQFPRSHYLHRRSKNKRLLSSLLGHIIPSCKIRCHFFILPWEINCKLATKIPPVREKCITHLSWRFIQVTIFVYQVSQFFTKWSNHNQKEMASWIHHAIFLIVLENWPNSSKK